MAERRPVSCSEARVFPIFSRAFLSPSVLTRRRILRGGFNSHKRSVKYRSNFCRDPDIPKAPHLVDFKNLSRFFYRGLKTSDRLKANFHSGMARPERRPT